ncbi:MAG: hypothetical protein WC208_16350 [Gallionella sp.]|jgi:hypothetical protein
MDSVKGYLNMTGRASFALPAVEEAADSGTIVASAALSGLTAGVMTVAAQPDYPRTLRGYLTDANATITNGTLTIVGTDQNGVGISDVLTFTAAGAQTSVKAFAKVVSVTWALVTGTVTTTSDTMSLGYGASLGLPAAPGALYDRLVKGEFNGADDLGAFSKTYGLYNPAGTMDGAKAVEVTFNYRIPIPN